MDGGVGGDLQVTRLRRDDEETRAHAILCRRHDLQRGTRTTGAGLPAPVVSREAQGIKLDGRLDPASAKASFGGRLSRWPLAVAAHTEPLYGPRDTRVPL